MSLLDFAALAPMLVVSVASILVMMVSAFPPSRKLAPSITIIGLLLALGSLLVARSAAPRYVTPLLVIDDHALFFQGLLLLTTLGIVALMRDYVSSLRVRRGELYLLLLLSTLGALVLVASTHFASLFIGIELLSVPLYGMIAYVTARRACLEASFKYLVLASTSVAFLAFGMAIVYACTGTMSLEGITDALPRVAQDRRLLFAGGALMLTGLAFKLAAVPFHAWVADVYEGAPAPVTAFLATVSKGAVLVLLSRYVRTTGVMSDETTLAALSLLAVASMVVGNLLAIRQTHVKRMLAYSSVAHVGYILVGFRTSSALGYEAVSVYIVAYVATTLLTFGVVSLCSRPGREAALVEDYRALFWRRPALALGFTLALLSLAGIPLTVGFVGKFYLVAAGAAAAVWGLLLVLIVTSAMSLVYYLRIVFAMFGQTETSGGGAPEWPRGSRASRLTLASCAVVLLWLGIGPSPLLTLVRTTLRGSTTTTHLMR